MIRALATITQGVAAATLVLSVLSACSSSDGAPPPAADAGATLAERCEKEPSVDRCATCCGYQRGILEPYLRGFQACACREACTQPCAASLCAPSPTEPSAECQTCLNDFQTVIACEPGGNDECEKVESCRSFRECGNLALCLDKPDDTPDSGPNVGP